MLNPDLEKILSFIPEDQKKNIDLNDPTQIKSLLLAHIESFKPLNSKDYLEKLAKNELKPDKEGGILVEPDKEFVIKTKIKQSGQKLFINVTSHPLVDEPEQTEIASQTENDGANEGIRLPMSVGEILDTTDKKNRPARVIDIIVNSSVPKKVKPGDKFDQEMLNLFANIVFGYLNQKYKIDLNEKFTVLKSLDYKGSFIKQQRVLAKKKPRIEMMSKNEEAEQQLGKNLFKDKNQEKKVTPEWTLNFIYVDGQMEEFDGFNFNDDVVGACIKIHLGMLSNARHVVIEMIGDNLFVSHSLYHLALKMPRKMDSETIRCNFETNEKILEINGDFVKEIMEIKNDVESTKEEIEPRKYKKIEFESSDLFEIY